MINKLFNDELKFFRTKLDFFINLYLEKKLPQTLLFTGDRSIGKLDFTYHLVNFILSQNEETKYNNNYIELTITAKRINNYQKSTSKFFLNFT